MEISCFPHLTLYCPSLWPREIGGRLWRNMLYSGSLRGSLGAYDLMQTCCSITNMCSLQQYSTPSMMTCVTYEAIATAVTEQYSNEPLEWTCSRGHRTPGALPCMVWIIIMISFFAFLRRYRLALKYYCRIVSLCDSCDVDLVFHTGFPKFKPNLTVAVVYYWRHIAIIEGI